MDNASKALIIAGAILLAVAIIGIGIYIYSAANSTIKDSMDSMDATSAFAFNQRFSVYMNKAISGTQVKQFLDEVINNNTKYPDTFIYVNAYDYIVPGNYKFTHKRKQADIETIKSNINNRTLYYISVTTGCGTFKGGYRDGGTYGCLALHIKGHEGDNVNEH